ncbi:hypothetical protein TSUD_35740 [Trifolium subterraneum]|uniref:ABC1 atypical kinase-like domain-containing protein n=1 Tax=Trifolium subterraneum TaxID=3900 RepID=A0A2Z6LW22_TRISU|nr:hypothetical protein TSUD_35740 [Trifolium subterraneum]
MSSTRDITRIFNGLTLIANEFAKRSLPARNSDFETLIKTALISATNISGITKGTPRQFSDPQPSVSSNTTHASSDSPSVVVFSDQISSSPDSTPLPPSPPPQTVTNLEVVTSNDVSSETNGSVERSDATVCAAEVKEIEVVSSSETVKQGTSAATSVEVLLTKRKPRERKVPSTPFSRALGFAGLGAGLAWGTVQESVKRLAYGTPTSQGNQTALSPFLSEKNAERLALALCRMRGAALKIGQMLSIQDESLVPPPILAALEIVRQGADVMPKSQLNQVLNAELGPDWSSKLHSFDYEPLAAASIGQVHRAVMKDGLQVAMKIQYPGVADSIESDIENVKLLLNYTNLIPQGLYLDRAIKVAKEELSRECDYKLEAENQKRFRDLLAGTEGFYVPIVRDDILSKRVLTTELIHGIPIDKVALLDQETQQGSASAIELPISNINIRISQVIPFCKDWLVQLTDPNWGNFLYNEATKTINLIDFGAARDFPKSFVDDYLRMVLACANGDSDSVIEMSRRLGFLTGMESDVMLDAHVQAGFIVGLPFSKPGPYDFRSANITQSISHLGATMLKYRLTPPPDEAYSLHRKLSGAFLACIKIGAVVPCRELLLDVYKRHKFGEVNDELLSSGSVST